MAAICLIPLSREFRDSDPAQCAKKSARFPKTECIKTMKRKGEMSITTTTAKKIVQRI